MNSHQRNQPFRVPSREQPVVSEWVVWVALVGGGVAWLLHFLAAYVISEFGCVSGWGKGTFLGVTGLAWLLLGVSVLMFGTCTWCVFLARRSLRRLRQVFGFGKSEHHPHIYMARAGYISNLVFDLIILVETLPVFFYLQRC